jgi:hypothetical protein
MKTNRFTFALLAGGLAAAAAVAVVVARAAVGVDGLVGYGAVTALVAFAVLDYGLGRRRLFSK